MVCFSYSFLSLDNCFMIWLVPVAVRPDAAPTIMATTTLVAGIIAGMK